MFRATSLLRSMTVACLLALAGTAGAAGPRYAYVSNAAEGTVSILDLRVDRVVGTVKTGQMGAHGVGASPDGRFGFAALESANEVVVIDGERQAIAARIPIPFSQAMAVHGLDVSPDGKYLWVGARQGGDRRSDVVTAELAVVNTQSQAVEKVLQTALGVPSHYAMTPDGRELWIASTTVDLIWIIDTSSRQVIAAIPLVPPPRTDEQRALLPGTGIIALNEVAISPDGRRAYAVGPVASVVFAIDVASRRVVGTVKSGRNAHGIAVSRNGKEVWTSDWGGTLTIIDSENLTIKDTVTLGGRPNHIGFSADGSKLYVTRTGDDPELGEVVVMDTATRKPLDTMRVGTGPHEISLEDLVIPLDAAPVAPDTRSSGAGPQATIVSGTTARDSGTGGVTFEASLATREFLESKGHASSVWGFMVSLDTHSVDLSGVDIASRVVLRDGDGETLKPIAWHPLSEDSHHRSGLLLFPVSASQAAPGGAEQLQGARLVLTDVGGVRERVLTWN